MSDLPPPVIWYPPPDVQQPGIDAEDDDAKDDTTSIASDSSDEDRALAMAPEDHLRRNLQNLQLARASSSSWSLHPLPAHRAHVVKPPASRIPASVLHPAGIRAMRFAAMESMEELAPYLEGCHTLPPDFVERIDRVIQQPAVVEQHRSFYDLPLNVAESQIEDVFNNLVAALVFALDVHVPPVGRALPWSVGGLLADHLLSVHGRTDLYWVDHAGQYLVKTEFKTARSFARQRLWYRRSRGSQVLGALYSIGGSHRSRLDRAPTLLLTQQQFKLFVETRECDGIATMPEQHCMGSTAHPIFLKVLALCLLVAAPRTPEPPAPTLCESFKLPLPVGRHRPSPERSPPPPSKRHGYRRRDLIMAPLRPSDDAGQCAAVPLFSSSALPSLSSFSSSSQRAAVDVDDANGNGATNKQGSSVAQDKEHIDLWSAIDADAAIVDAGRSRVPFGDRFVEVWRLPRHVAEELAREHADSESSLSSDDESDLE